MTVSSLSPINTYEGNYSNKKFDFDFYIENSSELIVKHFSVKGEETLLREGIDYSINEIGNKNGSYITFPLVNSSYPVLKKNEHISLSLDLPIKQESEFGNSSYFNFNVLEWTFDYIVRILQILSQKVNRCCKVSEASDVNPDKLIEEVFCAQRDATVAASQAIYASNIAQEKEASIIAKKQEFDETYSAKTEEFSETFDNCMSAILNESQITNKSNIDLDNLSEEGENHFVNNTHITNCVVKSPNNIFYTINSNTLTLKAGSILIVPYSTSEITDDSTKYFIYNDYIITDIQYVSGKNFFYVKIPQDITFYIPSSIEGQKTFFSFDFETKEIYTYNRHFSGTSASGLDNEPFFFYNTSANNCMMYNPSSASFSHGYSSFPFLNISSRGIEESNSIIYVGSCIFMNKGVQYIIPNGKNQDGTNNNILQTTKKPFFIDIGSSYSAAQYLKLFINSQNECSVYSSNRVRSGLSDDMPYSVGNTYAHLFFAYDKNYCFYTTGSTTANWSKKIIASIAEFLYNGDSIVSSIEKKGYSLADYNDLFFKCDDKCYHYGDEYSIAYGDISNFAASLTTSKSNLRFTVPLPKSIEYINTISVEALVISARIPTGGYLPEISWNALSEATVTVYKNDNMNISIVINSASKFASSANNINFTVSCNSLKLKFIA